VQILVDASCNISIVTAPIRPGMSYSSAPTDRLGLVRAIGP